MMNDRRFGGNAAVLDGPARSGRRPRAREILLAAALMLLASPSAQAALSGPAYTGGSPAGGTCSITGDPCNTGGATVSCSGVSLGSVTNLYFGLRNDQFVTGNTMAGTSGATSGSGAVFRYVTNSPTSITYSSTTTIFNAITAANSNVNSRLVLTLVSGSATVVSNAGLPANNGNGDITRVFQMTAGSSFSVRVDVQAALAPTTPSANACPTVFGTTSSAVTPTRSPGSGLSPTDQDVSRMDFGFYWSNCGDGTLQTPDEVCDQGAGVNGTAGSCCASNCQFKTSGNVCRTSGGACDVQETCTGTSAICPVDSFAASTVVCRGAAGECDLAENCTGTSVACPTDLKKPGGTACTSDGNPCTVDECDGSSVFCQHPAGNPGVGCRASAGGCDIAETCTGTSNACPADAFVTAGTECRGSAGVCDIAELCTGTSPACPVNAFEPATLVCRAAGGVCDLAETCTGTAAACPADAKSTSQCRASAGACDLAEVCDGTGNDCPGDAKSSAVCRAAAGGCDIAESCDGAGDDCPTDDLRPSGYVCNAGSGDMCDPDETCDGSNAACPTDSFGSSSTVCRAAAGGCDAVETCPGVPDAACPADDKLPAATVCRASVDPCDVADECDGTSDACPADAKLPDGTSCEDGLFCNGAETCSGGICSGTPPCPFSDTCNEAMDVCLSSACPGAPQPGCRTAQKNMLLIKNKTFDSKDKLIWKFIKGDATTQADFADPRTAANYALCLYAGTADTLIGSVNVPPSATKWAPLGSVGYKYLDPTVSANGAQKITLKAGAAGKSKALFKGSGANLPDPLDMGALTTPVTAQLLNYQNGNCWEGTFTTTLKNSSAMFKAKSP